jgi:tetratricopeptide (TPR) repeat protein
MRSISIKLAGIVLAAALAGVVFAQTYQAGTELSLIEKVEKARADYTKSLTELQNYYYNNGDMANAQRASRELGNFGGYEHYDYAQKLPGGEATQPVRVLQAIQDATDYYVDGVILQDSPFKSRKDLALQRYQSVITRWPDSDKAPLAAFAMGELYASMSYRDFDLAASYFKKAYDLNPAIEKPALVKAGDCYSKLGRDNDAIAMYKLAVEGSRDPSAKAEAERKLAKYGKAGK